MPPSSGLGSVEFDSQMADFMKYDFENFYRATEANFTLCEIPDRDPDFYSFSGSTYWCVGDGVVRWSNHWGRRISSCSWYIDDKECGLQHSVCGFCKYEDFMRKE